MTPYLEGADTVDGRHTFGVVSPFLKGDNSEFIAAIVSGLFS